MENKGIATISENELSKVKDNLLNADQLNFLFSKTPAKFIKERPAKGGGKWNYVSGTYIKKVLNLIFGWDWDFEIVDHIIDIKAAQVIVKGKLTCRVNGRTIVKMQFGRQDLKFKNEYLKDDNGKSVLDNNGRAKKFKTDIPLDLGNDLKGATTDALKKCSAELGIAADVYAPEEFKQIEVIETRSIEEMKTMCDFCENKEDLQSLYDSFSKQEKTIINDYINIKSNEL